MSVEVLCRDPYSSEKRGSPSPIEPLGCVRHILNEALGSGGEDYSSHGVEEGADKAGIAYNVEVHCVSAGL